MLERRLSRSQKKFLTLMIIVAVVISIIGTFFSFSMLYDLEEYKQFVSGHPTETGQVNLTIYQNLTIFLVIQTINFSTGYVNTGMDGATLNASIDNFTDSSSAIWPENWTNTSEYNPKPILLRNDGNVNTSITIKSGKNAVNFLGGSAPSYQFNSSDREAGSCEDTLYDYTDLVGDPTEQTFCTNLGSTNEHDELYAHCRIWVPSDTQGEKQDYWWFTYVANVTG